jgi:hypothetical protein
MRANHHKLLQHCLAASVFLLAAPRAAAQDFAIVAFGGWRTSGGLEDSMTQEQLRLRDGGAASVALDFAIDASRQLEIFASRQRTELSVVPAGATARQPFPLTVTYVHLGGTNFFDGPIGRGPYVVGGIGVTNLSPGLGGFRSETRPSLNVGIGYLQPLAGPLALRFEARGYMTLVNSSGGLFCSGGCVLAIRGDSLTQGEVLIGVSARF